MNLISHASCLTRNAYETFAEQHTVKSFSTVTSDNLHQSLTDASLLLV